MSENIFEPWSKKGLEKFNSDWNKFKELCTDPKPMKPGTGYVIVEIPPAINSIKTASGIDFYIDSSFDPEKYANVWGTVVGVPERTSSENFRADRDKKHLVTKDKEVRLQPGDKVYFHYLTIKNAKKSFNRGTYFEEGGKRFAILPYSSLFFAIRKPNGIMINVDALPDASIITAKELMSIANQTGVLVVREAPTELESESEYIMLNDWVLIEPIRKGQHTEFIKGYGNFIVDDEATTGKIILTSDTPYKASEGLVRACPPGCGLEVGGRIIFEKESDIPVEYDLCRTLEKPYWRMKLEDIIAKRTDTTVQLVRDYTLIIKDAAEEVTEAGFFIPETSQKQPLRGEVVMVGPDIQEVAVGNRVVFENDYYTEFPFEDRIGVLVREEKIQVKI